MISGLIFEALGPLVSNRCYPSRFPQEDVAAPGTTPATTAEPTWPAIRYTLIGGEIDNTICGSDSRDTDNTTVQIDVVAKTYGAMVTLMNEVMNALVGTDPPCTRDAVPAETWDAETRTHRGILTYTFHASTGDGSPN